MRERKLFGVKIGAGVLIIISCITVIIIQSTSAEENGTDEIILNFSFTEPEITEVNISNTTYQIVTMNETKSINNEGLPVLPVKPLEILLPQNGTLKSINVNYSGKTSIGDGYNILLGKQSMSNYSEQQNETNETKFNFSEPYPTDTFNYFGTNYFHGFSILVLNINPVYYTVETGEIYYYKNMSVTITINKSGSVHSLFRGLQLDEISMKQLVNDYSMNYTYTDVCTSSHSSIVNPSESYDYVIITTENLKDASPLLNWREWYTFQDLVDYKNAHGTTTTIVAVEDIDENYEGRDLAEKIRNFIIDAYKNWNTNYILIGGDANKIPVRNLWGYSWPADPYGSEDVCSASDLYYACLDGSYNEDNDDKWGEVFDGAPGGDYYEPPRKPSGNSLTDSGNLYAEADSNQYGNGFNVGLFIPSLDLTGINSIKLTFSYNLDKVSDYEGQDIIFLDINTYSGGTNLDKHNLWHLNTNNKGFITLEFDPSTYTDPSDVYVEFYYSDIGASSSFSSLNIDEVLVYTNGDEKLLEESFESNEFPPIDWTQIVYSGDKYWNKEYYRIDVDLFPEIYIGRACVGNKMEVRNFVLKTLSYENIPTHDPYLKKVLLIGGKMHDDPEFITWGGDYKDGCIDFNNEYIETYGIPSDTYDDIDTLYDRDWENNWWDSCDFRNKVNPGVFILNAALHGDEFGIGGNKDGDWTFKFTNIDVDLFTNNKCSFLYFQSCLVGNFSFESYDCFAEHFTVKTPHGAFATIMNSKSGYFNPGTTDGASQRYDREFWDAIFGESQTKPELKELGPANEDSKLDNYYLAINPDYRALQYSLNLFGDPQISIKIPEENYAPNTPTTPEIYSIYNNRWYTFSTSTTDPNGDQIQYKFKWDNHESLFWTQWYNSGQVAYGTIRIPVGTHQIRVKARDVFNYESEWSDPLPVTVPFDLDIDIYSSTMVLGEEIQFYGTASDAATEPIKTWNYNLADGSYANVQNINHTYSKVGTYNVTLTVIDNENITSNVTKVVRIVLLKSDINCSSDHGTPNETILFNDSSDSHYNIINWHWDFGDGDTSNNRNTSHAYNTEGAYNVT